MEGLKLFGMWASPFSLRVEWALRLKGVEYEFLNELLPYSKSPELLHYNPITKKVPTLVHNGRPLAESLVILEYIDDVFSRGHPSFMPEDPYERAQARFWANFAEDKGLHAIFGIYLSTGEDLQRVVQEAQETLRTLEKVLEGKSFFGGDAIGFLDLVVGWIAYWIPMIEELAGVSIVNDESHPALKVWFRRFLEVEAVKERLPPKDKLYALNRARREELISGKITYNK